MRSTIHLLTADDAVILRPLTLGVLERTLRGNQLRLLDGVDLVELEAMTRRFVEDRSALDRRARTSPPRAVALA